MFIKMDGAETIAGKEVIIDPVGIEEGKNPFTEIELINLHKIKSDQQPANGDILGLATKPKHVGKSDQLCHTTKIHGAIRLSSGLVAMVVIVMTVVIKLSSALSDKLNKTVEDVFILILYVVSDLFIIGSYLYGHYFKKEMLTHSRSTRSSNRWIKGLIALFAMAIVLKDTLLFIAQFYIDLDECSGQQIKAAKYFFHGTFVLLQVMYLFKYAKVFITHCSGGTRMGLMIVIATNISSWLAAIVDETLIALEEQQYSHGKIKKDACYCSTEFCKATHVAEKFLFPFMIEFSLVASILLFITWNNAGKKPPPAESVVKPSYKFYNNYTGAGIGGFALIATVIVIIVLGTPPTEYSDLDQLNYTDQMNMNFVSVHQGYFVGLELVMMVACVMAFYYFAMIRRPTEDPLALDVVLLFICIIGPFILNCFTLLAVFAGEDDQGYARPVTVIQPVVDIVQCCIQLAMIIFGLEREPVINLGHHPHYKPKKRLKLSRESSLQFCRSPTSTIRRSMTSQRLSSESSVEGATGGEITFSGEIKQNVNFDSAKNSVVSTAGIDNVIFEGDEEKEGDGKEKRKIGSRIMRRIRHVSTSLYPRGSVARKRTSTETSSIMSEATVATPDEPRLQLRNVLMFLILTNVCLWIVQSLEGTAFTLYSYQSVFFGQQVWTTILMICRPLSIFFRMHSAGCLFEIWSYA